MSQESYYNTSQLFKLGKLKTVDGTPIKSRNQVFKIVKRLAKKAVETPWGLSNVLSQTQIDEYNKKREAFAGNFGRIVEL